MKTMMKKCGMFTALAAASLVIAVLVTGCPAAPVDDSIPAGMGVVRLNFNPQIARATIVPGDITDVTDFDWFHLNFTAPGALTGTPANMWVSLADTGDDLTLDPGTYNLTITAYQDPSLTAPTTLTVADALAMNRDPLPTATITVTAGVVNKFDVTLSPIFDSTGEPGQFAWEITTTGITAPNSLTAAAITITRIDGTALTTPINNQNIISNMDNTSSPISLPPGFYNVDFTLTITDADTDTDTKTFRHILHVYQNMTSVFTYGFVNGQFYIEKTRLEIENWNYDGDDKAPLFSGTVTSPGTATVTGAGTAASPYLIYTNGDDTTTVKSLTITVTNFATAGGTSPDVPYTSVAWSCNDNLASPLTGTTASTLAIVAGTGRFASPNVYQIGITGILHDKPYYNEVYVKVDVAP